MLVEYRPSSGMRNGKDTAIMGRQYKFFLNIKLYHYLYNMYWNINKSIHKYRLRLKYQPTSK